MEAQLEWDNDVYKFLAAAKRRQTRNTEWRHASLKPQALVGSRLPRDPLRVATGQQLPLHVVTLGQDLYTPHLDRTPYVVEQWELERPYFAWLFLRGTARVSSPSTLHTTSLALGVTGPPAGGELAQQVAHRIGFNEQAAGWETQIGFERRARQLRRSE